MIVEVADGQRRDTQERADGGLPEPGPPRGRQVHWGAELRGLAGAELQSAALPPGRAGDRGRAPPGKEGSQVAVQSCRCDICRPLIRSILRPTPTLSPPPTATPAPVRIVNLTAARGQG